jgi:hypothetical protein
MSLVMDLLAGTHDSRRRHCSLVHKGILTNSRDSYKQ